MPKIPVVLDGSYKAGVVYGLQTASFNALKYARKCYGEAKQSPKNSLARTHWLERMKAANQVSMQNREASRRFWALP